jgi:hypothetical protein
MISLTKRAFRGIDRIQYRIKYRRASLPLLSHSPCVCLSLHFHFTSLTHSLTIDRSNERTTCQLLLAVYNWQMHAVALPVISLLVYRSRPLGLRDSRLPFGRFRLLDFCSFHKRHRGSQKQAQLFAFAPAIVIEIEIENNNNNNNNIHSRRQLLTSHRRYSLTRSSLTHDLSRTRSLSLSLWLSIVA